MVPGSNERRRRPVARRTEEPRDYPLCGPGPVHPECPGQLAVVSRTERTNENERQLLVRHQVEGARHCGFRPPMSPIKRCTRHTLVGVHHAEESGPPRRWGVIRSQLLASSDSPVDRRIARQDGTQTLHTWTSKLAGMPASKPQVCVVEPDFGGQPLARIRSREQAYGNEQQPREDGAANPARAALLRRWTGAGHGSLLLGERRLGIRGIRPDGPSNVSRPRRFDRTAGDVGEEPTLRSAPRPTRPLPSHPYDLGRASPLARDIPWRVSSAGVRQARVGEAECGEQTCVA